MKLKDMVWMIEEGPIPLHDSDTVEVPVTTISLSGLQLDDLSGLLQTYNEEFGIDAYLGAQQMVRSML